MAATRQRRVQVNTAPGFKQRYRRFLSANPDIRLALRAFNEIKHKIPTRNLPKYMRDHTLRGRLAGLRECHLAGDVLLIYTHLGDVVNMIDVCSHTELMREEKTIERIAKAMERAVDKKRRSRTRSA
jgi:addiction module RelE/StbE family toxin